MAGNSKPSSDPILYGCGSAALGDCTLWAALCVARRSLYLAWGHCCTPMGLRPIQRCARLNGTPSASTGLTVALSFLMFFVRVSMKSAELPCPPINIDQPKNINQSRYQRSPYFATMAGSLRFQLSYHLRIVAA